MWLPVVSYIDSISGNKQVTGCFYGPLNLFHTVPIDFNRQAIHLCRVNNFRRYAMTAMSYKKLFKKCPNCGFEWKTRGAFLIDPELDLIGYQCNFKELDSGLFYFNHSCKGTLTVSVGAFEYLYDGQVFEERATGTMECPGFCLHKEELEPCPTQCECSYVREIIQIIRRS
jgi:hypothetical protein